MPTARTPSRWLKRFTMKSVEHLMALNAAVIAQILLRLGIRRCRGLTAETEATAEEGAKDL